MKLDRFESSSAQDGRPLVVLEPVQKKYELDFLYSLKFITLKFLVITNQDPLLKRKMNCKAETILNVSQRKLDSN